MRVAIIDLLIQTPYYDRYLAEALAPLVDDFTLYAPRFLSEPDYFDGMTFRRTPGLVDVMSRYPGVNHTVRRVGKLIEYLINWSYLTTWEFRRRRPDVVHIQWLPLLANAEWELFFCSRIKSLGIPLVLTVHNARPHEAPSVQHAQRLKRLYQLFDHFVIHAETDRDYLLETYAITSDQISAIPHGPVQHEPPSLDRETVRASLGIDPAETIFLMIGLIRPYKAFEEVIQAFCEVTAAFPRCKLLIVGKALDAGYLARLQRLAGDLQIHDRVQWQLGYVLSSQVAEFHLAADAVLFPYRDISQSGAFLTAAGLGCCTIVHPVGAIAESVQDGQNALTISTPQPEAIATGMKRFLELPQEIRLTLGKNLQAIVEANNNWNLIAQKTLSVYRNMNSQYP